MAATQSKRIILITGGNGGIGFELASQLAADKTNHVIIGSRSLQKGEAALQQLRSLHPDGSVEMLELDVTKKDSITAAAEKVDSTHGRLDALVNNAGVAMPSGPIEEQMMTCFITNAVGPWLMTEAFAPLLKKSTTTPRIISVSSGGGSISEKLNRDNGYFETIHVQYRASKAAMNMVTACQLAQYNSSGFKVFTYCPGLTVSNLSEMNKPEHGAKPTSDGARPMVDILNGKRDEDEGKFLHHGGIYNW